MNGARRCCGGGQSGLTLVELLVVLTISSVLLGGLAAFTVGALRAATRVDRQTTDVGNGQLAMVSLSRDLRAAVSPNVGESAPLFLVAAPDEARFFAALGDGQLPVLVRMSLADDQRLVEDITPAFSGSLNGADLTWNPDGTVIDAGGTPVTPAPDAVDPDGDASVRYIASFVVNDADTPIFRYLARSPGGLEELEPAVAGENLSLEQRRQIAAVEITMTVASDPSGRTGRFMISNTVRLPAALGS